MRSVRISEVCKLDRESVPVQPGERYPNVGVLNRGRGLFRKPDLLGSETKYSALYRIHEDQIIYSKLFGWEGAVALVDEEFDGSYVSPEFPTFTLDRGEVWGGYLHHVLGWSGFSDQLSIATTGMGQRRQRVNIDDFECLVLPLPALSEQRRIAAHLDRLALVASTSQSALPHRTVLTRAVKNSVVQEAGGRMHELGDLLAMRTGELVVADARYRMTGVYSFGRGLLNRGVISGSDTKYKTLTTLRSGNVVYSKLGAFENAVAVVDGGFDRSFVSPEFPVFEICAGVNPDFLRAALTTSHFAEALGAATSGVGARQKRVSPNAFLGLEIRLPEVETQERVAEMLRVAQRVDTLMLNATTLAGVLVPAARNKIFSAML
ncbi:restriction endonuclease subunit S [soil metagenome]